MRVTILGSGSPRLSLDRSAPSVLIEHNHSYLLVDCGDGTMQQLLRRGIEPQQISAILFTHLHADHALGFGQFLLGGWIHGRRELFVAGPPGTTRHYRAYVETLFPDDIQYRINLGRSSRGLLENVIVKELAPQRPEPVSIGPFQVTYCEVPHSITTLAYRIRGSSQNDVVVSGDTRFHPPLAQFSTGTTVLIHEAAMVPSKFHSPGETKADDSSWETLRQYHSTAREAGEVARRANASQLILTHLLPGANVDSAFHDASQVFPGTIVVAQDLMSYGLDE